MLVGRRLLRTQVKPYQFQKALRLGRSFGLWPFSKKSKTEAPAKEEEDDPKNMENLYFLIEGIKKENAEQGPLLPDQDPKNKGKITVCAELEDVFLFVFCPDELEGYLYQPRITYDYYIELPEFDTSLYIYKRQGFDVFAQYMRENCEGVIFTGAMQPYADKVLDIIDKDRTIFQHRLYQDACNLVDFAKEDIKELVKDVERLGRDPKRTVMIDTKPLSFWCNPDNGLPIKPFRGGALEDPELPDILDTLKTLKDVPDVRPHLAKKYNLRDFLRESNML